MPFMFLEVFFVSSWNQMSILCEEMDSSICDGYQELITLIVKMEILLCSVFMALAAHCLRILNSHPSTHIMFERVMLPLLNGAL